MQIEEYVKCILQLILEVLKAQLKVQEAQLDLLRKILAKQK